MKTVLALISIALLPIYSNAQRKSYLFQPDTLIKSHASYDKVKVIDLRKNKNYKEAVIGHNAICFKPRYPVDSMISNFASLVISKAAQKDNKELLIALYDCNVTNRKLDGLLLGNLYLNVRCYLGHENQYKQVAAVDSLFECATYNTPELSLSKAGNKVLSGLLLKVANAKTDISNKDKLYTREDIASISAISHRDYPVYFQQHQAGVYYTLDQFLNNTPGDTTFVQQHSNDYGLIIDKFYIKAEGAKKPDNLADTCFAIFNGTKWFTPYGDQFKEMKIRNDDFYFQAYAAGMAGSSMNTNFFVPMTLVGGAIGAGLAGVISIAVDSHQRSNPNKMRKATYLFKLDPELKRGIRVERYL
jgi:hypothetical protein